MTASLKLKQVDEIDDAGCEELSCLIDGELGDAQCKSALERLCADPQARARWAELHFAADALRSSEVAAMHSDRFHQQMAAALAEEPALLAPAAFARRRVQRMLLPGMAVAAAVALLAVVVVPQLQDSGQNSQLAKATSVKQPASATDPEVARVPELERYLLAHRELAGGMAMPQTTPYMRTSTTRSVGMR